MGMVSVQQLMSSINILDPIEKDQKQRRHPKNEFQAYAYRLAHDLNDLQNLQIYMRLSKTVERNLMEQAYSFVSDSTTDQKGRLFLWKLKQIRAELQKKRDMKNFDYDFVIKKMSKLRDKLAETIKDKAELEYMELQNELNQFFQFEHEVQQSKKKQAPKALFVGYTSPRLLCDLVSKGYKINGVEISKELSKRIKDFCQELKTGSKIKWVVKDFMQNSFEEGSFDVVFVNNYWNLIPQDSEIKFLNELKKVLKKDGKLIINYKISSENKQEWKNLKHKGEDVEIFVKSSNSDIFKTYEEASNLKVLGSIETPASKYISVSFN